MNINFRRVIRGPGWERWVIIEDQHGDSAFAGEVIMTYADISSDADVECSVLFARELSESEAEEVLTAVVDILSGQGNITIFTAHEITAKGFSLLGDEHECGCDDESLN